MPVVDRPAREATAVTPVLQWLTGGWADTCAHPAITAFGVLTPVRSSS
jgi:hypothetical protein